MGGTDRISSAEFLANQQYHDDGNLRSRQSLYDFAVDGHDLFDMVLDLLVTDENTTIADVGCGNGRLRQALGRRRHHGLVVGLDQSPGMAATAAPSNQGRVAVADARAIPLADDSVDATAAIHMLYHVADPDRAIAEMRRVTRAGGPIVLSTNSLQHLSELDEILEEAMVAVAGVVPPRTGFLLPFTLENGRSLVGSEAVEHRWDGRLEVTDAGAVGDYIASLHRVPAELNAVDWRAVTAKATALAANRIAVDGHVAVGTHTGAFVITA